MLSTLCSNSNRSSNLLFWIQIQLTLLPFYHNLGKDRTTGLLSIHSRSPVPDSICQTWDSFRVNNKLNNRLHLTRTKNAVDTAKGVITAPTRNSAASPARNQAASWTNASQCPANTGSWASVRRETIAHIATTRRSSSAIGLWFSIDALQSLMWFLSRIAEAYFFYRGMD